MDKTPCPDWASAWLKPRHFHPHCPQEAHPGVPREQADACGEASPGASAQGGPAGLRERRFLAPHPSHGRRASFPPATARQHLLSQVAINVWTHREQLPGPPRRVRERRSQVVGTARAKAQG